MLRTDASAQEVATLREALRELSTHEPRIFELLFDPATPHEPLRLTRPAVAAPLISFGLVHPQPGGSVLGVHRIRRVGGGSQASDAAERLYVMEIGDTDEYGQDVWPETDALLEVLGTAPPGRLLDVGTGTGILAIEAAARGHQVIACDLYDTSLTLARFNAALNGLSDRVDLRRGHLFDPVAGELFDRVLSVPHYSSVGDHLRFEVLRDGPRRLAPGGKLHVATFLEWEEPADALPAVEHLLAPLVREGAQVRVTPIRSPNKSTWFSSPDRPGAIPGLTSRHRFTITVDRGAPGDPRGEGSYQVELPAPADRFHEAFVPLSAMRVPRVPSAGSAPGGEPGSAPLAVVSRPEDVAALRAILSGLREGLVVLEGTVPRGLVDECRFGLRTCVSLEGIGGAASAIAGADGGVRPCAHGDAVARVSDPLSAYVERLRTRAVELYLRRGCAGCAAVDVCTRCLFPGPLADEDYCALVREHRDELPALQRLLGALAWLGRARPIAPTAVKIRRTAALLAARGRPLPAPKDPADVSGETVIDTLALRWRSRAAWLIRSGPTFLVLRARGGENRLTAIDRRTAEVAELVADGATGAELRRYARDQRYEPDALTHALDGLASVID